MKPFNKLSQSLGKLSWNANFRQMRLPIVFSVSFSILLCIAEFSVISSSPFLTATAYFFGFGFLLTTTVQLSAFRKPILANTIGLLFIALDCFWIFTQSPDGMSVEATITQIVLSNVLLLSMFVVPNLRQNDDTSFTRFTGDTITTAFFVFLAVFLTGIAIMTLMYGIETLFNIRMANSNMYLWIMLISVACSMFVMLMPRVGQQGFVSGSSHKGWLFLGKFILLPILFLYLLVLYLYIIKILVTWQLPDGVVTYLTVGIMAELLAVEFIFHARMFGDTISRFWRTMRRLLPLLVLPPVVLMSIGLARRVSDYGWTIDRFYVLLANVMFYVTCLLLFVASFRKFKVLTVVTSSFCALFLIVSVIPGVNISTLTRRIVSSDVQRLIESASTPFPEHKKNAAQLRSWYETLDPEEAELISSKLSYLSYTFGKESISQWVTLQNNNEDITYQTSNEYRDIILMRKYDGDIKIPEGYSAMYVINDASLKNEDQDSVTLSIPVSKEASDSVLVKIAVNAANNTKNSYLTVNPQKDITIVITHLYILKREYLYCDIDGYAFRK